MENFYFKNRVKYGNGEFAKDISYYKLSKEGKITSISNTKRTLAAPKSITIFAGFEVIEKDEFDNARAELGF